MAGGTELLSSIEAIAINAWGVFVDPTAEGFLGILVRELSGLGCSITRPTHIGPLHFVSIQHSQRDYSRFANMDNVLSRTLVTFEPSAASPMEFSKHTVDKYDKIIRSSPLQLVSAEERHFGTGIFWHANSRETIDSHLGRPKSRSVGMINANKVSLVTDSLYAFRQELLRELPLRFPSLKFSIAGLGWGDTWFQRFLSNLRALFVVLKAGRIPNISLWGRRIPHPENLEVLGEVSSALAFLSGCEFALVVENEATYVSEKLANAVLAGSIPLYCGPPLSKLGIPNSICVQLNANVEEFAEAIKGISPQECNEIKTTGQRWLQSDDARNGFSYEASAVRLAQQICEAIKSGPINN